MSDGADWLTDVWSRRVALSLSMMFVKQRFVEINKPAYWIIRNACRALVCHGRSLEIGVITYRDTRHTHTCSRFQRVVCHWIYQVLSPQNRTPKNSQAFRRFLQWRLSKAVSIYLSNVISPTSVTAHNAMWQVIAFPWYGMVEWIDGWHIPTSLWTVALPWV